MAKRIKSVKLPQLAVAFAFLASWFLSPNANSCTLSSVVEDIPNRTVLIGKIIAHVTERYDGQDVLGLVIDVHSEYRSDQIGHRSEYLLFPSPSGANCSRTYIPATDDSKKYYSLGTVVTAIGYPVSPPDLGDLELSLVLGLVTVGRMCTEEQIAEQGQYLIDSGVQCGSRYFHITRDVTLLAQASDSERLLLLTRLATASSFMLFEDLVDRYAPSEADRDRLMKLRYGNVISSGCKSKPNAVDPFDPFTTEARHYADRWHEYCTQERQDRAQD